MFTKDLRRKSVSQIGEQITVAEKGHPPRVGAGPAAGRVASGMGGSRCGKRRVGAGGAAGSP